MSQNNENVKKWKKLDTYDIVANVNYFAYTNYTIHNSK